MTSSPALLEVKVHGMDCAEETTALKRELGPLVGGEDRMAFDLLRGKLSVRPDRAMTLGELTAAVARTGMTAEPWRDRGQRGSESFWQKHGRLILASLSGAFTLAGFLSHAALEGWHGALGGEAGDLVSAGVPVLSRGIYLLAILAGAWYILPKAWASARHLRPDMNLLMVVAAGGAIAIGDWLEAATVTFLFAVSLVLESWSVGRARRAVEALLELAPPTARVKHDGHEHEMPPEEVAVGSVIVVRPGERFPLDGQVLAGESYVNQAPITGESVPVLKQPGGEVYAGAINGDGALEVRSTRAAEETLLARTVRLVADAHSRRAPSEQWVETFARYYTPAVMVLALFVLLLPPLLLAQAWGPWIYRALVLLVIACPCALVISTPVSIVAALAAAARQGVLIKGGVHIETPASLAAIAFDKTGTLTQGKLSVTELVPLNGHSEAELLERAAALELRSPHPAARAIVEFAHQRGVKVTSADDVQAVPGKGATATFAGRPFWLGSHRYLVERGQETPDLAEGLAKLAEGGRTVVIVGNAEHVCGLIALSDSLRPEAAKTVAALHALGLRLVMLTGDNLQTASQIARLAGVDDFRAELLPADKVTAVEELVAKHGRVAMVGDGVNDAPALARATLGIAMGAMGTDAALETADVALMSDDLSQLPWLITHSRRTLAIIRQNIRFALGVKVIFCLLTFAGYASLWGAIAADTGASLAVIANGLRLLRRTDTR